MVGDTGMMVVGNGVKLSGCESSVTGVGVGSSVGRVVSVGGTLVGMSLTGTGVVGRITAEEMACRRAAARNKMMPMTPSANSATASSSALRQ